MIDQHFDQSNSEQTNEESENAAVGLTDESQPAEQETVEQVENTESDLVDSVQTVDAESTQNSIKDKMIGYYQDLVTSFSSFMNFLK